MLLEPVQRREGKPSDGALEPHQKRRRGLDRVREAIQKLSVEINDRTATSEDEVPWMHGKELSKVGSLIHEDPISILIRSIPSEQYLAIFRDGLDRNAVGHSAVQRSVRPMTWIDCTG
jgi:uncharacterized FlaG/YvyC family protein